MDVPIHTLPLAILSLLNIPTGEYHLTSLGIVIKIRQSDIMYTLFPLPNVRFRKFLTDVSLRLLSA